MLLRVVTIPQADWFRRKLTTVRRVQATHVLDILARREVSHGLSHAVRHSRHCVLQVLLALRELLDIVIPV